MYALRFSAALAVLTATLLVGAINATPAAEPPLPQPTPSTDDAVVHTTTGVISGLDSTTDRVTILHMAVPSAGLAETTTEFSVARHDVLSGVNPGDEIEFTFVRQRSGRCVVTRIVPAAAGP